VSAVFVRSPLLAARIRWLKSEGRREWSVVFGKLLYAWLSRNRQVSDYDLVVANPTYTGGASGRAVPHTELVIEAATASDLCGLWPFDVGVPRALVKVRPTPRSRGSHTDKERAADLLLDALVAPDRRRLSGRRILVYDDICTTGLQLDRVARFLRDCGARSVEAVVLARTPWTEQVPSQLPPPPAANGTA
jgi:predicted amidophosphoribosyltransferase